MKIEELAKELRAFAHERDWEQFHSPKNLAMALCVEASELMEHFQWLTQAESTSLPEKTRGRVADEIGDVLIYLVGLADTLGIDPLEAAFSKVGKNREKYPVEKSRGKAEKYTETD